MQYKPLRLLNHLRLPSALLLSLGLAITRKTGTKIQKMLWKVLKIENSGAGGGKPWEQAPGIFLHLGDVTPVKRGAVLPYPHAEIIFSTKPFFSHKNIAVKTYNFAMEKVGSTIVRYA